jgi:predicted enzyme related to lactoylglutathione lyase
MTSGHSTTGHGSGSGTLNPAGVVVRPVRFTDDIPAMRSFLELLGLASRVESEAGGWVQMVAEGGMVALHSAERSDVGACHGQTNLSFETDDADLLRQALLDAGFADATVYDEGYGRVLSVTDPLGEDVHVDEYSDDPYGFKLHDIDRAAEGTRVVPVRFTNEAARYGSFLRALGLTGTPAEDYCTFSASDGAHGSVGVHYVYDDTLPIVPGPGANAHLTFTSTEDLDALADRLRRAGADDARVVREDFGGFVTVTDPDGQNVQVHESAR